MCVCVFVWETPEKCWFIGHVAVCGLSRCEIPTLRVGEIIPGLDLAQKWNDMMMRDQTTPDTSQTRPGLDYGWVGGFVRIFRTRHDSLKIT